jgi:nicotinamidase-related amidase
MGEGDAKATRVSVAGALLAPDNCALMLIDYESQMFFGVQSTDRQLLINNTVGLAKAARVFGVPTLVTTVTEKTFSGPMPGQLAEVFPDGWIDRTTMNPWEDENVVARIVEFGRPQLILAGLWTEVCVAMPALSALEAGYEVYVVVDACGSTSEEAQGAAIQHMVQAGAAPVTWLRVMLELQRDWARQETAMEVQKVAAEHAGAYGQGMRYVMEMFAAGSRAS